MYHFYYNKTANEACAQCDCTQIRTKFLTDIIKFHCHCLDKNFVMEIALNCEEWFGLCIPYLVKTIMLNQHERWKTISSNWPYTNSQLCGDEMSKSKFYYTGAMDNTICAFCALNLHDWKQGDEPLIKHYDYNPFCPYLIDHTDTLNVDKDQSKLYEMMRELRNETM